MNRIVGHEVYRVQGFDFIGGGWHWMHPQCTAKFAKLVPEDIVYCEVPLSDYTDDAFPNIDKCDFCDKPIRGRHKGTHES